MKHAKLHSVSKYLPTSVKQKLTILISNLKAFIVTLNKELNNACVKVVYTDAQGELKVTNIMQ